MKKLLTLLVMSVFSASYLLCEDAPASGQDVCKKMFEQIKKSDARSFASTFATVTDVKSLDNCANNAGEDLIIATAKVGNKQIMTTLVENGIDTKKQNKDGETGLMIALKNKFMQTAKLLINNETVGIKDGTGKTPLMMAARSGDGSIELIKLICEKKVDVNAQDESSGDTAVMIAIKYVQLTTLRYLVDAKNADLSIANNDGLTALDLAKRLNRPKTVRYIQDQLRKQKKG